MFELIQFAVSLIAILALAGLVGKLRLGGAPMIRDEDHAAQLAHAAVYGFAASDIAISRSRDSALVRDADNRVLLLYGHGSKFAGRLLTGQGEVRLNGTMLEVTPTDRVVGTIRLELPERRAQEWAASLRRLNTQAGGAVHA